MVIPIAITRAVRRDRLWDIDGMIRRTRVCSVLTGLLALAHLGSRLLLPGVFGGLTGNAQAPWVTALSTVVIAGLYLPVAIARKVLRRACGRGWG